MRDYLDEVKTRLLAGADEAAGSRGRHRRLLAIAPVLMPVALVAAVVLASATSAPGPPRSPVPAGFNPVSFTAIGDSQWWLLGGRNGTTHPGTWIVETENGGRSFFGIPAPPSTQVHQLRFANAADGYAFGTQLWSTHSGGASWRRVAVSGDVSEVAASDGWVYALVRTSDGGGRLLRSPAARDAWRPATGLVGFPSSGLWAHGPMVMVETQTRTGSTSHLLVSSDFGGHFRLAGPAPPSVACQFESTPPVIWAPCATGTMSGVWRSTDGGATFVGVGGDATRSGIPEEPNSAGFAAASPAIAVYGFQQLWRTNDAGADWSRVLSTTSELWFYLGFTDPTHGIALGGFHSGNRVYYTTNGGRSYRYVAIRG